MSTFHWPSNRTLITFSISLVVATAVWFLNALNKNYTTTISHSVSFVEIPQNRFITNHPPEKLHLKVAGHGFALLRYKMGRSFSPLTINVSRLTANYPTAADGLYVISTQNIRNELGAQLNPELQLIDISPGVFSISFDSLEVKQVPVAFGGQFSFKPGFGLAAPLNFTPSRVTVSGPQNAIDTIDSVYTLPRQFKNLESTFSQEMMLNVPSQVSVNQGKVMMLVQVSEFTQKTMRIPVKINPNPEKMKIRLFPNEVEVSFRVALSNYALIKPDDIELVVSWEEMQQKHQQLEVYVQKLPQGVHSLKINPGHVEYLIEKK